MAKAPVLFCDDGAEIALPSKWVICSTCSGNGKHSAHLGAFTADDMAFEGPDFLNDYMAGFYDKSCESCDGTGKVAVADRSKMTREQRDEYDAQRRADREYAAEVAAERRAGC